jgi:hypothetical protein
MRAKLVKESLNEDITEDYVLEKIEDLSDDGCTYADKAFKEEFGNSIWNLYPNSDYPTRKIKDPKILFWNQKFDEYILNNAPEIATYKIKKNYYNYWLRFGPQ